MDVGRDIKFTQNAGIRQVGQGGVLELQLHDQCRMLHEALVVFRPGGREFARRIDRRRADRVPPAAEAAGALAG